MEKLVTLKMKKDKVEIFVNSFRLRGVDGHYYYWRVDGTTDEPRHLCMNYGYRLDNDDLRVKIALAR